MCVCTQNTASLDALPDLQSSTAQLLFLSSSHQSTLESQQKGRVIVTLFQVLEGIGRRGEEGRGGRGTGRGGAV